jgi:hypothetical protein
VGGRERQPPSRERFEWARRLAARLVPAQAVSGIAYGLIVIGALLAAESGHHEGYTDTIASALIATAIYWLAHAYASALGRRIEQQERLSVAGLSRALAHDGAIVRGAAIPLLVLALAWAVGARLEHGVSAAVWSSVASLVALELTAGIGARASRAELVLDVAVGAAMGLGVLALKALLH